MNLVVNYGKAFESRGGFKKIIKRHLFGKRGNLGTYCNGTGNIRLTEKKNFKRQEPSVDEMRQKNYQ